MVSKKPDGSLEWVLPEKILLLKGWRRNGLTQEEIAKNIGISVRTLYLWKGKHKEIEEALKLGKEEANFLIENALFNKARSGNTTAMIFWLKNNWRQKYNDSNKTEEETNLINAQKELLDIEMELKKKKLQNEFDEDNNVTINFVGFDNENDNA